MKKVILLSGPYGVGKTTLANNLVNSLDNTVMFDGEWAWFQGNNWNFSKENKKMALDNICYILSNFLKNDGFDVIIFSWVLHKQEDHHLIIEALKKTGIDFELFDVSLIADSSTLKKRLEDRISTKATEFNASYGKEQIQKALQGSLNKLQQIIELDNIKLDVSSMDKEEVLEEILKLIGLRKKEEKIYIKH